VERVRQLYDIQSRALTIASIFQKEHAIANVGINLPDPPNKGMTYQYCLRRAKYIFASQSWSIFAPCSEAAGGNERLIQRSTCQKKKAKNKL
jgi:hypothetical protein